MSGIFINFYSITSTYEFRKQKITFTQQFA